MEIGNKILELRKKNNLSQEQLAEKMGVARQTISKWELGETSPDLIQAKELSKIFKVSLDDLTNNDIKEAIVEKVSNTEKLADLSIRILKILGVLFIIIFIIDIVSFLLFGIYKIQSESYTTNINETIRLQCSLNDEDYEYLIQYDKNDDIIESSGSEFIDDILKDKNFSKRKMMVEYIESYFKDKGGDC